MTSSASIFPTLSGVSVALRRQPPLFLSLSVHDITAGIGKELRRNERKERFIYNQITAANERHRIFPFPAPLATHQGSVLAVSFILRIENGTLHCMKIFWFGFHVPRNFV
jgi:hypothetical protein